MSALFLASADLLDHSLIRTKPSIEGALLAKLSRGIRRSARRRLLKLELALNDTANLLNVLEVHDIPADKGVAGSE